MCSMVLFLFWLFLTTPLLISYDFLTFFPPVQDDSSVNAGEVLDSTTTPPGLRKKRISINAIDPEVRLPAGHTGAGWVTLGGKHLTAINR